MLLCKVQDKCVSTIKHRDLKGLSLVTVRQIKVNGSLSAELWVVVDPIGCHLDDEVIVVKGQASQLALDQKTPIDMVIVGIKDSAE